MKIVINKINIVQFSLLFIINSTVATSPLGVLVCILQYLYVTALFFQGRRESAIYWHLIFTVTSYARLDFVSTPVDEVYNYFSLKLVGPITLSYLYSILLYVFSLKYTPYKKYPLFEKTRKFFYILGTVGIGLGIIGLFGLNYFAEEFINYTLYIAILLLYIEIIRHNDRGRMIKKCFESCIPLFVASVIGVAYNVLFGISILYGTVDTYLINSVSTFVVLAILVLPQVREKFMIICTIIVFLFLSLYIGASGKFFFNLALVSIVLILRIIANKKAKSIAYMLIGAGAIALFTIFSPLSIEGQSANKLHQAQSVGDIFKGDISMMDNSPYIRVASIMNIYHENISNPVYFVAGRGYGGYFEDNLGILRLARLDQGGFKDEYISKNKFPKAHSTFAIVPLLNGFGGFCIILYLVFLYVRKSIKENYLGAAALLWLLMMFYYNILIGIVGVFLLFSSEFEIKHGYNKK